MAISSGSEGPLKAFWSRAKRLVGSKHTKLICMLILVVIWVHLGIFLYIARIDNRTSVVSIRYAEELEENNAPLVRREPVIIPAPTVTSEKTYYSKDKVKTNPHNYTYLLNEPLFCVDRKPFLLLQIHSRPNGRDRRDAIRETWASKEAYARLSKIAAVVFLVGRGTNPEENANLTQESREFHDIIQEDFIDSYENLTIKSIMGMKFAAIYCPAAKYTLKTDDDMFINIEALLNILEHENTTGLLGGGLARGAKVMRGGRWKVTQDQYPYDYFPVYCAGAAYVASLDVARKLYETSEYKRRFDIEDAYVTGIVSKVAGIEPKGLPGFPFWITRLKADNLCKVKTNELIGLHALPPSVMRVTWSRFLDPAASCTEPPLEPRRKT